jgi:uncharacterized protein YdaU (DUF1376 family)
MAKDPAFLFYYQDYVNGTRFMSLETKGAYVDALCYQADKGSIPPNHMSIICGTHENIMSEVCSKFETDADGNYFNERLKLEQDKRKKYSESRRKNRLSSTYKKKDMSNISKTYVKHMEDVNKDVNVNRNKSTIEERKNEFLNDLETFKEDYSQDSLKKFFLYWTEHGKNDRKMRFELAKNQPFSIQRRLVRWKEKSPSPAKYKERNMDKIRKNVKK